MHVQTCFMQYAVLSFVLKHAFHKTCRLDSCLGISILGGGGGGGGGGNTIMAYVVSGGSEIINIIHKRAWYSN